MADKLIDVLKQAIASGRNFSDLIQSDEIEIAESDREQMDGLRNKPKGTTMVFPESVGPFNTKGMKYNIDIDKYDEQGELVQSYRDVPPGLENLPMGPKTGTVIETPSENETIAKTGGPIEYKSKGLWHNIHAKRARGEKMRKKGDKGAPTDEAIRRSQKKGGPVKFQEGGREDQQNVDMDGTEKMRPFSWENIKKGFSNIKGHIKNIWNEGLNEYIYKMVRPGSYPNATAGLINELLFDDEEGNIQVPDSRNPDITRTRKGSIGQSDPYLDADGDLNIDEEAYRMALGLEVENKYFKESDHRPSIGDQSDTKYFSSDSFDWNLMLKRVNSFYDDEGNVYPADHQKPENYRELKNSAHQHKDGTWQPNNYQKYGDKHTEEFKRLGFTENPVENVKWSYIGNAYAHWPESAKGPDGYDPYSNFKVSLAKDKNGYYISYYDQYNFKNNQINKLVEYGGGSQIEFYDKKYVEKDKNGKWIFKENQLNDNVEKQTGGLVQLGSGGVVKYQTKGAVEVELNQGDKENVEEVAPQYQALIYLDPTDADGYFTGDYERMTPTLNEKYGEGNYKVIELPEKVYGKEWEDKKNALHETYGKDQVIQYEKDLHRKTQLKIFLKETQRRIDSFEDDKKEGTAVNMYRSKPYINEDGEEVRDTLSPEELDALPAEWQKEIEEWELELNELNTRIDTYQEDGDFASSYSEVYDINERDRGYAAGSDERILGLFDDIGNLNPNGDIIIMQHGNDKIGPLLLSEGDRSKHSDWNTPDTVDTFAELLADYGFEGTCYGGVCGDSPGEDVMQEGDSFKEATNAFNLANEVPGLTTKFAIGTWSGFQDVFGETFDEKFFNNIYNVVSPHDGKYTNVNSEIIVDPKNKDHRQISPDYKKGGVLYKKGGSKKGKPKKSQPYKKPPITATDREKRMYWLQLNSDKNFVQRILSPELNRGKEVRNPQDGLSMTHYMTSMDNLVFPMVIDKGDGTFHHFKSEDEAYQYAMQSGEYIRTDTEEEAMWLGKNYKTQEFNIAYGNPKYKKGGPVNFLNNFKFKSDAKITKYQTKGAVNNDSVLGENKSDGQIAGPLYTTDNMQSDYTDEVLLSYLIDQSLIGAGIDMNNPEAVKKGRERVIYAMNRIARNESQYSPKQNDAGNLQYDEVGDLIHDGDTAALGIYQIKVPENIHPQELKNEEGELTGKMGKGPIIQRLSESAQQNYDFYKKLGLINEENEPGNKYQHTFINDLLEHNDPRKLTKTQQDLMFLTSVMYSKAPLNDYLTSSDEDFDQALQDLYFKGWHKSGVEMGTIKKGDEKYEEKLEQLNEDKENWSEVNEVFDNENYRDIKIGIHDDYDSEKHKKKKPWSMLKWLQEQAQKEKEKKETEKKKTGGRVTYQSEGFIPTRHDNVGTQSIKPLSVPKNPEELPFELKNIELLLDKKKEEIENKFFSVSEIFPNMKKWKRLHKGIDLVDINVITALDELSKILPEFEGMDLLISSALRSKDWNTEVGGRSYSRHLFGMGLDIIGTDAKKLTELLSSSNNPAIVEWRKKWTSDKHGHSGRGVVDEWATGNHLHLQFKDVLGTGANYQTYSDGKYTTLNNYNRTFNFSSSFARSNTSSYNNAVNNIFNNNEEVSNADASNADASSFTQSPTDQVEQHQQVIRTAMDDYEENEEEEDWRLELEYGNNDDKEKELTLLDNITFNRSTPAFQNAHGNSFLDSQNQIFLPYQSPFKSGKRPPQLWGYDDPSFMTALQKRNAEIEELELGLQENNEEPEESDG